MTAKRFASFLRLSLIAMLLAGLFAQPGPVSAASLPAQINKQFTPLQIDAGGVSVLRVTVFNPNSFPLTSASWTDDLVGVQPGLFIANPAGVVNTCGGSVTAAPNTTTLSLTGGTVPAQVGSTPGQCYVEVNVSSVTPGNLINTIPANNLSSSGDDGGTPVSITNTTPASATITVIAVSPPSLSKSFAPNTIFTGQTSTMTIRLNNNDVDTNLTGASYTDTLPSGLVVATPNGVTATGCGPGVVSAISGGTTISLTGGTVTPSVDCVITVSVTGASGQYTNTIPAGPGGPGSLHTDQGVTNNSPASANLNVQPVAIAKSFSPSTVDAGDVSTLTITLQNPTGSAYTGASITDSLLSMGAGFTVAGPPSANTCGFTTITAPINGTSIAASGGTIPASATPPTPVGTCVLSIPVRAALTVSGTRTNTIPANTLTTTEGVTNYLPATANLAVRAALYGTKSYSPTAIPLGGTSTVTITLYNRSDTPLTSVAFTDTLPAGLTVSAPASPQCGGTVTNTASTVTLSGGTIPANGSCTIVFTVTSSVAGGPYVNTVDANTIANDQGVGNAAFSTPTGLTVSPSSTLPVRVTKAFQTNPITPGQPSRLRITLTAPVDTALSGLNIVDTLPAGLFVTTPSAPTDNCPGANVVAPINGNTISLTGATLNAGASCNIDVWVTSSSPDLYVNTIPAGAISTTQGRTNDDPATASIRVTSLTATKAFYATVVQAGGRSTMTITLQNNVTSPLVNVSVTDNLPGTVANGIRVAAVPNASTTCGAGVITATPGSNIVSMTGGTVPAQVGLIPGLCTITVDVVGTDSTPLTPNTYTNTIPVANISGTVQNTGVIINPVANASAVLTIQNLTMGIVKGFNPVLVYGGAYSTMSIDLINPNTNTALTGIAFTDDMTLLGTGMKLANPVAFNTGTCGGTLTGNPGDASFSYSGGALPANSTCTLTLRVVMDINGNRTNRIPVGAVTTFNGVSNAFATEASLTNLPGVSINKNFNPSTVLTTQPSVLTITIKNTSNIPVVNMGLADNLPGTLPDGLEVANPANVTNTCGGTVTANPGSQTVQLVGGSLAELGNPGDTCAITVNVISTRPGVYINTIPSGALTSDGGITNNDPATDTLTVEAGIYSLGNRVWFDTNNDGLLNGTEVGADGVTVELYAADVSGAPTGASLGTAVTSSGGYYRFDNLPAGDYVVVIPSTQFASGGPLEGYWSSGTTISSAGAIGETAAPDPDNDLDNDDNGTRQTSGAFNGAVLSGAVTLGPGTNEPTGDNDPTANPEAGEAPNNQSNRTVDFGFYRQQLGNLVFVDVNGNGTYDAGDTPLAGATVELYAADGTTLLDSVVTGGTGLYLFDGLAEGDYIVKVTPPAGYTSAVDTAAPADTTDPNANTDNNDNGIGTSPGQVSSAPVTLTPGDAASNNTVNDATGTTTNPTLDFGFDTPIYSLGNRVWFDTNNDGLLNGTEVGADGVTVELYAADVSGAPTGASLGTAVTSSGGYYRFDNLPAGDYVVVIPSTQFASGGPLEGYWSSGTTISSAGAIGETAAPDPDNDLDNDDNGTRQTSGAFNGAVLSGAVTLGPGTNEPTGDNDPTANPEAGEAPNNQSNRTVDFGFYRQQLGNLVFVDVNGNGTYDAGDTPLAGATVELYAADGTTLLDSVVTGGTGLYLFDGLAEGDYIVKVTPPAGYTSAVDTAAPADTTDPNANTDNNDNGIGTSPGQVSSAPVTLTPGDAASNNTVNDATGTTTNPTLDFGFDTPIYSLGNRVWFDTNNDGLLNGTEVGADGVTVELYAADVSGAPTGASLGTAVTSSGGYYRFDNLPAGDYVVVIPSTQFASGGPLEGYWSSGTTISSAGAIGETAAPDPDNDLDNDDNGTRQTSGAFNGAVLSGAVTLGPGTNEPTGDNDPTANPEAGEAPNNQSNRTVDFGFYRQQLGNLVFLDDNRNGTFDAGDTPLAGATVQLYAADGVTEINVGPDGVLGTADDGPGGVTTDASGNYLFSGLPAGSYIVKVTPPAGYVSTIDTYDPADTTDPNANTDNNDNGVGTTPGQVSSNLVTLTPGDGGAQNNNDVNDGNGTTYNPTVDFGFRGPLIDLSVTKAVSDATPMVATDITFTIAITNSGPDTATGVQVTDALPAGFTFVSSSATQGTYNDATGIWDVGTLLVSQTATLTLTVTVNVTGPYANYVQVTRADQTDVDSTPGNNSTDEDDDDSVTVTPTQGSPSASKSLSGSNQAFTTNPNVAIGEIVEYTVTITIPPGVFPNSRLVDTMQSGLSFMECASITASSPALTTSAAGSFTGVCASPTVDDAGGGAPVDVGRRVAFDFGTLTNTSRVDQTLTIVYTAVVLDSAGNVSGTTLANGAVWSSDSGTQTLPPVFVFIVEPELSLEKSASTSLVSLNSKFKITLTIQHTAASQTNAYDAVLTDVLPLELELVTGTLECVSGAQNADTCTYDAATRTVRAVWNNFALGGGNGRVTFFVRVTSLPPGGVSNTAYLLWTSLPGDVSVPQNSNIFSKERDYDPGSAIDVYGVSDTVTVGVFSGTPATGFAPNVVTDLSQAPKETYAQTGGVMLEIPSLGINIPIVGVPLKNGEWNVTWLGNQAGWLEGSAFPSWSGNSVLTGHVYGANGLTGPFVNLARLKYGDKIIVHAYGSKYIYEVRANTVVEPDDAAIFRHEEKAWLTLVTCKEYDEKTNTYKKRVVARAVLVGVEQ
jgi:LPXTG-site transpeptidase (sortase) family protein